MRVDDRVYAVMVDRIAELEAEVERLRSLAEEAYDIISVYGEHYPVWLDKAEEVLQ